MYKEIHNGVELTLTIDEKYFSSKSGYAATKEEGRPVYTGNFKFEIVEKYHYAYQKTDMGFSYVRKETILRLSAGEILQKHGVNISGSFVISGSHQISPTYAKGVLTLEQISYFKSLTRDKTLTDILE